MTTRDPMQHANGPRWLRNALRALAAAMGAVHCAVAVLQQSMNEDGISYLDMGDAYLSGDWSAAVNGIWSPAYAWVIALAIRLFEPSIAWEFPTVQLTNFAIYIVALFCFEFFWGRLTSRYYADSEGIVPTARFPPPLWLALGYSLFIWSSLDLINLWAVTPDMGVAAVAYLVAGRLLDASARRASPRAAFAFGLLLGLGYLVKAALLPLGLVALALAALAMAGSLRERAAAAAAALAGIVLVGGPLIAALSLSAGQLTIGDVGRFTYLKHVNEMPYPDFHEALERLSGTPTNPPRRLFADPPIYEFAEPIAGTYPMAYNPGYWTRGLEPTVTAAGQLRALITSAMAYFDLFMRTQGAFLAVVLLLFSLRDRKRARLLPLSGGTALLLWSLAAFGMYAIVHVLPRYIAPFVVLFWAGILGRLRFAADPSGRKLASVGAVLLIAFVWVNLAALHLDALSRVIGFTPLAESASQPEASVESRAADHVAIAADLLRMGMRNGDRIGFIGYSYTEYWARLGRLKIVAEIHAHDTQRFWEASAAAQAAALAAFAGAGAVAVIAQPFPLEKPAPGWQDVGNSGYRIRMLP
jgi:hypothetical protein